MTIDSAERIFADLDRLLDAERAALLTGDLDTVGALMRHKEDLLERLKAAGADAPRPAKLAGKALRNQALLDGALEGIRTVAGRLTTLRRIRRTLETYDRTGRKSSISDVIEHQVEKRA
ncbi:flagellar protein FlgN [Roseovarius aquimarinus]|uniref:Flagellar protein FlgN n=1 Tax=Roseovarius aquimarinus TaxID=1229156 RepID=A0ABW7IA30_9RHOB